MTEVDRLFAKSRDEPQVFKEWMGSVELPIRLSLRRFARTVDVESVVQETLLRMWVLANDPERTLDGENASLRFALGVARNLARAEARRMGRQIPLPPEDLPEVPVEPAPPPSPGFRAKINECIDRVAIRPRAALRMRLMLGGTMSDRALAASVDMTLNTFLQNITRARKQVQDCLERAGIRLREIWT